MAERTQPRRIRVRGRQREDIDLDLLVQALILIGEERAHRRAVAADDKSTSPDTASEAGK